MRQMALFSQTETLARSGPEGRLYVKHADLYYGDTAGTEIRLTADGYAAGSTAGSSAVVAQVVSTLPTAKASYRGRLLVLEGSGLGDRLNICLRKPNGTDYGWYEITRAI